MASLILTPLTRSYQSTVSAASNLYSLKTLNRSALSVHTCFSPCRSNRVSRFHRRSRLYDVPKRGLSSVCFYNGGEESKECGIELRILKRWDVPWNWQTISLTSLACGLSFVLTGLIEAAALPYLGIQIGDLGLDEKAEILFVDQGFTTAVILAILYNITKTNQDPDDLYHYDWRDPFNLQSGWLLWAGIGLVGAVSSVALIGAAMSLFSSETPPRETDSLVLLLPLIGSSSISMIIFICYDVTIEIIILSFNIALSVCLLGITGVLAPVLEENVFRGFLIVSLTKWLPTPLAVFLSAAVFALAHLTPGQYPQLFVLGSVLGFSYAQTRNLLTPITIHAFWNSGVILLLTFLQLQGYDIKELLQAAS